MCRRPRRGGEEPNWPTFEVNLEGCDHYQNRSLGLSQTFWFLVTRCLKHVEKRASVIAKKGLWAAASQQGGGALAGFYALYLLFPPPPRRSTPTQFCNLWEQQEVSANQEGQDFQFDQPGDGGMLHLVVTPVKCQQNRDWLGFFLSPSEMGRDCQSLKISVWYWKSWEIEVIMSISC